MNIIKEISMTRNDAMNRALDLSEMFILFFDKIYNNPTAEEEVNY